MAVRLQLDDKLEPAGKVTRLAAGPPLKRTAQPRHGLEPRCGGSARRAADRFLGRPRRRSSSNHVAARTFDRSRARHRARDRQEEEASHGNVERSCRRRCSLSRATTKNTTPHIACLEKACAVVWDDDNAGAYAAYVERDKPEPLWHRDFSPKGIRPTLVSTKDKTFTVWYEDSRLKLAEVGRDGVGKPSVLGRVNGFQPEPDVAHGEKPGQWLVAFRDYESGHFEAFGLRAECP